jgi:hypothetical protein
MHATAGRGLPRTQKGGQTEGQTRAAGGIIILYQLVIEIQRRTPFPSGFAVFIDYSELSSSLPWSRGAAPVVPTLGSRGASAFVLYSLAPNIPGSGPLYRHHVKQQPLYGASAPGRCNYTSVGVFTVGPLPQGAGRPKTFGRSSAASRPCFATSVAKARAGKGVDPTPTGASQCARPLSSLRAKRTSIARPPVGPVVAHPGSRKLASLVLALNAPEPRDKCERPAVL